MQSSKRNLGLLAAAVIVVAGIGIATTAYLTHAEAGTNNSPKKLANRMMIRPTTKGTVTAINGSSIALTGKNNTAYTVDATNAKINKIGSGPKTTIPVSGISIGDTLTVTGTVSGTNITATNIIDGARPAPVKESPVATGTVSNLSGNTFTLTNSAGTAYTVDASNLKNINIRKLNTSLQNGGVQNGDIISVYGTLSGNNITASSIQDGNMPNGWPKMMGQQGSDQ